MLAEALPGWAGLAALLRPLAVTKVAGSFGQPLWPDAARRVLAAEDAADLDARLEAELERLSEPPLVDEAKKHESFFGDLPPSVHEAIAVGDRRALAVARVLETLKGMLGSVKGADALPPCSVADTIRSAAALPSFALEVIYSLNLGMHAANALAGARAFGAAPWLYVALAERYRDGWYPMLRLAASVRGAVDEDLVPPSDRIDLMAELWKFAQARVGAELLAADARASGAAVYPPLPDDA